MQYLEMLAQLQVSRVTDITDVILNVSGAVLGYLIYSKYSSGKKLLVR